MQLSLVRPDAFVSQTVGELIDCGMVTAVPPDLELPPGTDVLLAARSLKRSLAPQRLARALENLNCPPGGVERKILQRTLVQWAKRLEKAPADVVAKITYLAITSDEDITYAARLLLSAVSRAMITSQADSSLDPSMIIAREFDSFMRSTAPMSCNGGHRTHDPAYSYDGKRRFLFGVVGSSLVGAIMFWSGLGNMPWLGASLLPAVYGFGRQLADCQRIKYSYGRYLEGHVIAGRTDHAFTSLRSSISSRNLSDEDGIDPSDAYLLAGRLAMAVENPVAAVCYLGSLLRDMPDSEAGLCALVRASFRAGRPELAAETLRIMGLRPHLKTESDPVRPPVWKNYPAPGNSLNMELALYEPSLHALLFNDVPWRGLSSLSEQLFVDAAGKPDKSAEMFLDRVIKAGVAYMYQLHYADAVDVLVKVLKYLRETDRKGGIWNRIEGVARSLISLSLYWRGFDLEVTAEMKEMAETLGDEQIALGEHLAKTDHPTAAAEAFAHAMDNFGLSTNYRGAIAKGNLRFLIAEESSRRRRLIRRGMPV